MWNLETKEKKKERNSVKKRKKSQTCDYQRQRVGGGGIRGMWSKCTSFQLKHKEVLRIYLEH